jgi:hypothetical protein
MAKSKKGKRPFNYSFESTNQRYDFTKICRDMQRSEAWKQLKPRQIGLYFLFKSKFTVKLKTFETNVDNISFTTTEAKKYYGDLRTFRADVDILIEYGFIRQIISGVPTMSASIYGFSDRWKDYGTDKFNIPDRDKRYKRKPKVNE